MGTNKSEWEDIPNIKLGKTDVLITAFQYAVEHKVDTVELQLAFNDNMVIQAKITFGPLEEDSDE